MKLKDLEPGDTFVIQDDTKETPFLRGEDDSLGYVAAIRLFDSRLVLLDGGFKVRKID